MSNPQLTTFKIHGEVQQFASVHVARFEERLDPLCSAKYSHGMRFPIFYTMAMDQKKEEKKGAVLQAPIARMMMASCSLVEGWIKNIHSSKMLQDLQKKVYTPKGSSPVGTFQ